MDRVDLHILSILQEDATATVARIAASIGLSQSPCWKRIHKLESSGVLVKRVALVSPAKVGLGLSAYIEIQTGDHSSEDLNAFTQNVAAMPEVVEFSRTSGDVNYIVRVIVADIKAYDAVFKRLTSVIPLRKVAAHFVSQRIKWTTSLPLSECASDDDAPVRSRINGEATTAAR